MRPVDVVVASFHPEPVRLEQHVRVRVAVRRLEPVRRELERHPEDAFPEADRGLPVGADQRDVVDALALDLPHGRDPTIVTCDAVRVSAAPTTAEVRRICGIANPVIRNLEITECYARLAAAFAARSGGP